MIIVNSHIPRLRPLGIAMVMCVFLTSVCSFLTLSTGVFFVMFHQYESYDNFTKIFSCGGERIDWKCDSHIYIETTHQQTLPACT